MLHHDASCWVNLSGTLRQWRGKHPRWDSRSGDARLGHTVDFRGAETAEVAGTEDRRGGSSAKPIVGRRTRIRRREAGGPLALEGRYRAASLPKLNWTERLAMEDTDAMNSLPERIMEHAKAQPEATTMFRSSTGRSMNRER